MLVKMGALWSQKHLLLDQSARIPSAPGVQHSSTSKKEKKIIITGRGRKKQRVGAKVSDRKEKGEKGKEEKRKEQKLVKAHCKDLAGFKPRSEPPHPRFEEIR